MNTNSNNTPAQDKPAADASLAKELAVPEKSENLVSALNKIHKSGRSASLLLNLNATTDTTATVVILTEAGELVGRYEISASGIKAI